MPANYLNASWPLRYAAIDKSRLYLAIAGARGLAHCYLPSQKWKLFGNENQERDFIGYGGLAWWSNFIVCPGYNLLAKRDEVRQKRNITLFVN